MVFCCQGSVEAFSPWRPLTQRTLAQGFDVAEVDHALQLWREHTYGVVLVDGDEAVLVAVRFGMVMPQGRLAANIASRTRRGGQSAARFGRNRDGEELAFLRKVAERAQVAFGEVKGVVLAGRAEMKRKLLVQLPQPLQDKVARVADLNCRASEALQEAAALVKELASSDRQQQQEALAARFLELAGRGAESVCYGSAQARRALRAGAASQLLVAASCSPESWRREAAGVPVVEVADGGAAACQFCEGFQVGVFLKYALDLEEEDEACAAEACCAVPDAVDSEAETASGNGGNDEPLLGWLEGALEAALKDAAAAKALAVCAELVLFDEGTEVEERLEALWEMLRAEGVPEGVLAELACHAADRFAAA